MTFCMLSPGKKIRMLVGNTVTSILTHQYVFPPQPPSAFIETWDSQRMHTLVALRWSYVHTTGFECPLHFRISASGWFALCLHQLIAYLVCKPEKQWVKVCQFAASLPLPSNYATRAGFRPQPLGAPASTG